MTSLQYRAAASIAGGAAATLLGAIRYGDDDLAATSGHTARRLLGWARPRPAAIIVLAGAALILVGIAVFGYTTTRSSSEPAMSAGGIVLGLSLSILPGALGTRMLFRAPTVWQGIGGLAIGILTFLVQRLLIFLILLALTMQSEAYVELQPGFWLSIAGCATIALGGIVCLVQAVATAPRRAGPASAP